MNIINSKYCNHQMTIVVTNELLIYLHEEANETKIYQE